MLIALNEKDRRIGEDHHNAILTDHEVETIRSLAEGGMRYEDIAEKFGISKWTVGKICRYERRGQTVVRFKQVPVSTPRKGRVKA